MASVSENVLQLPLAMHVSEYLGDPLDLTSLWRRVYLVGRVSAARKLEANWQTEKCGTTPLSLQKSGGGEDI